METDLGMDPVSLEPANSPAYDVVIIGGGLPEFQQPSTHPGLVKNACDR